MDKELAQLEEWAVDLINNYENDLLKINPKASMHKRIKRFSGELVANPEAYAELLELGRSKGMTGEQLVNAIRRVEQGLLDEAGKGKAPSRKQLMSDVIHHFYAQRTGGDTLRRLGQADRQQARAALRDEFGRWGNVSENLRSLFRAGHLNTDVLKGIEAEAMAELGVTKASQLAFPKAHTTKGKLVTGDIPGATTAQEAFEGMKPQFEIQGRETQAAIDALQPLMDDLDIIAGSKYRPDMSEDELLIRRNLFTAKADEVKAAFQRHYKPYIVQGGSAKFNAGFGLGAMDVLKRNLGGALFGAVTSLDPEAIKGIQAGEYGKVAEQAALGTALGTAAQQAVTGSATVLGSAQRMAALGQIPGAIKTVAGAVKFAPPVLAGMAGYQALDVITTTATGKTLAETGQAAEQTKEKLRQQGVSEYELRRKARTGRF